MTNGFEVIAVVLAFLGVALWLAHIVRLAVHIVRRVPEESRPQFLNWGYLGGGLLLALVAYFVARGLLQKTWTIPSDVTGLAIVFVVASGGYGVAYDWLSLRVVTAMPWFAPLVVSVLLGATAGAAGLS